MTQNDDRCDRGCLPPTFFHRDVVSVARALIGARLLFGGAGGVIVETEAYDRTDPASHTARGRDARNATMFGPPGHAYVYRSYGLHWCLNLVCGPEPGAAVLIRALEPTDSLALMAERRGTADPRKLCAGPGRLCQALAITGAQDGAALARPPFSLWQGEGTERIVTGTRIGLTKGIDTPWRFGRRGSPFLSRRFP
jgi:DNA-3-methyladenine glycosylase